MLVCGLVISFTVKAVLALSFLLFEVSFAMIVMFHWPGGSLKLILTLKL